MSIMSIWLILQAIQVELNHAWYILYAFDTAINQINLLSDYTVS